ncbi:hypothetical protein BC940DRAFT_271374 [Gongronella butleri]|nr:hypothetical protein BC940DRAFT_271374 [Gongronella butleri]
MESRASRFHTYHGTSREGQTSPPPGHQRHASLLGRPTVSLTASTSSSSSSRHWEAIQLRDNSYFHKFGATTLAAQPDSRSGLYPCMLSSVAQAFVTQISLTSRYKNNIEYANAFDGQQAVDKLLTIIGNGCKDRVMALKLGRALMHQGYFHDVQYESLLMDASTEIYQLNDVLYYYYQQQRQRQLARQYQQQHQHQQHSSQYASPSTGAAAAATSAANSPCAQLLPANGSIKSEHMGDTGIATTTSSLSDFSLTVDAPDDEKPNGHHVDHPQIQSRDISSDNASTNGHDSPHGAPTHMDDDDDNLTVLTTPSSLTSSSSLTMRSLSSFEHDAIQPIHGIFTPLTHCYVPTCLGPLPCYSPTCPKRAQILWKHASIDSRASTPHTYLRRREQTSWAAMVPDEVLATVSTTERKRQEAICELINTEANFVMDLDYVEKMWIEPLLTEDILPSYRRADFVNKVFSNTVDIHRHHARFARALQRRQQEHPIIVQIGDIISKYMQGLSLIVRYGAHQHQGKAAYEKEKLLNGKFHAFVDYTERHPSSHKLELNGYLTKPTTRLGRYPLLLNAILKRTAPDHPDYALLNDATDIIRAVLSQVNSEAGEAKNKFDLERIHRHLTFKRKTDRLDLKLLDADRQIVREGFLNKRPTLDAADYQVILFDHYLVVTKVKWVRAEKHYLVVRRPLPIAFLSVAIPSLPSTAQRSPSFLLSASRYSAHLQPSYYNDVDSDTRLGQPIVFQHMGRKKDAHSQFTLYASSAASRKPWVDHIYQLQTCNASPSSVLKLAPAVARGQFVHKRVHHLASFLNNQLFVFAAEDGVYAGKNTPDAQVRKVLHILHVMRVHVIEEFQMLLLLADKTLWQFSLTELTINQSLAMGKRLYTNVPFFHAGICLQRTLICVPTRVSPLKSIITVLEPCKPQAMSDKKPSLLERLVRPTAPNNVSATDVYLQKYKECYVPCEAWAVDMTSSKLMVTGHRGIEVIDLQRTDRTQSMLNHADPNLAFITQTERQESNLKIIRVPVKRISVFRTPLSEYLVCYNEFAFYINGKGDRVYEKFLIEWEGCSESYALLWPYIIAFDPSLIEIRNALTGQLEQVIRGDNIRCIQHRDDGVVYGAMTDPRERSSDYVFALTLLHPQTEAASSSRIQVAMEPCSTPPPSQ